MKLFFDTEFTGLHQNTTLISIGMITEDNYKFYAEFSDFNHSQIDDWIYTNVICKTKFIRSNQMVWNSAKQTNDLVEVYGNTTYVTNILKQWLIQLGDHIEMWSDCLAYDWVLFCELFGGGMCLPKNIYYIPFDICTMFKITNIDPDISREQFSQIENDPIMIGKQVEKHNALFDAIVIKKCYEKLDALIT